MRPRFCPSHLCRMILKLTMTYDLMNLDFTEVDAGSGRLSHRLSFRRIPKRRLEVWWSDQNKRKDTYLIVINGSQPGHRRADLHLGLGLADLEKP
jgi:hypothetical protein